MSVADVSKAIKVAFDTPDPKPGVPFEKSAKYKAMADAVSLGVAHSKGNKNAGQLSSLAVTAAFTFLYTHVINELKDQEYNYNFNKDGEAPTKKTEKSITKPGPNSVAKEHTAGNYYERLGVPRDADRATLDKAYRDWARTNHPDVLRSKGASPEEIAQAEESAAQMGEAYNVLKSPTLRPGYDQFWDSQFSNSKNPGSAKAGTVPQLEETIGGTGYAYVNVNTKPTTKPKEEGKNEVLSFQDLVKKEGGGVTPWLTSELRTSGLLPEGFDESQIMGAAQMYSRGITSESLLNALDKTEALTDAEKQSMGNMALFMEYMEGSESSGVPTQQTIAVSTGSPIASLVTSPSPEGLSFSRDGEGGLKLVFDKATNFVKDKAGNLVKKEVGQIGSKTIIGKALKEGGKKVLKEGSKVLAKGGAKLAAKTALSAFFESINAVAPGLGTVLDVLVNWVLPLVWGAFKSFFKSLLDPENVAKMFMFFGGIGAIVGGAGGIGSLMLGGAGILQLKQIGGGNIINGLSKAFSSAATTAGILLGATFAAFGWPFFIALIVIPMSIAILVVTMTTGAYLVPPFLPHTGENRTFENPYIGLSKTLVSQNSSKCNSGKNSESHIECANIDIPVTVEYTVTIEAKRGPLSNISINDECKVRKEGQPDRECSSPSTSFPINSTNEVSPTESYSFTYTRTFDNAQVYFDSAVYDTVTVTASSAEGTSETIRATASICFGNCPQDCPEGWPVIGTASREYFISQGPFTSYTHEGREAIDVHTEDGSVTASDIVISTHTGSVASAGVDGWGGLYVDIHGNCNGTPFRSRHVHFSSMDGQLIRGATVVKGQTLGIVGKTGSAYSPHDHYEFRAYDDGGAGAARSTPPLRMEVPYVPVSVPRGCLGTCGISIPED